MNTRFALLAAASAFSLLAGAASAQTAPAEPAATTADADAAEVEEVVVTGTRSPGRTRLETVSPVDVVTEEALVQQGSTELATALARITPSLSFPRPAISDGSDAVRPATLRGLAPDQTLVLVNGARRHASALVNVNTSIGRGSAAVDLNAIPSVAIDRIEVLREGASAQYGSDAIAGVINLRLREAREGGSAYVTFGQNYTEFETARQPGGREARDGVTYTVAGWQGLPLGDEGFITVSGEYRYRNPTNRSDLDPRVLPTPKVTARYGDPQTEDITGYVNAGLPMANGFEAYGWLGYQHRNGESAANPRLANNANNVVSIYPNGFLPFITTDIDDFTSGGGVRGELGGYDVDLSVVYGRNDLEYGVENSVNGSFGAASPTSFYAGRLLYQQLTANLDFTRQIETGFTAAPANLAFGAEHRREYYDIEAGDTFSYAAGPLAGIGGRAAGAQGFPGLQPANEVDEDRNSFGLYVDVELPITDRFDFNVAARYEDFSDFGDTLTGKAAARYEFSPAFALRGSVSTGFRAPGLQQSFFTATSTNFIAINGVQTPVEVGTFPATSATARALGALPLEPEEFVNYALGGVFQQGAFELSVDAYRIDIDNRIVLSENIQGSPTGTPTQRAIFALINPPGTPGGLGAARFFVNGVESETQGVDIVARYRINTDAYGRFDLTGAANFNETKITRIPTTGVLAGLPTPPVLFDRQNRLTFEQGTPEQKHVAAVDWSLGGFAATAKATYYGDVLQSDNNPLLDFQTGASTVLDLEGRYRFDRGFSIAVGADNITDEYPNATPTIANSNGPLGFPRYAPYGFNGRFVYARVSYDW